MIKKFVNIFNTYVFSYNSHIFIHYLVIQIDIHLNVSPLEQEKKRIVFGLE